MKKAEISNKNGLTEQNITLRDYYFNLPEAVRIAPRKDLIDRVATRCKVPFSTARSWLVYRIKPRYDAYLQVLSEETGIPIDQLYAD